MLRVLLQAGAGKEDAQGLSPAFEMASRSGSRDAMRLLLEVGATTPSNEAQRRTMLMMAAASGVPSIVQEVLETHADVNARDQDGRTALTEAVGQYHLWTRRSRD